MSKFHNNSNIMTPQISPKDIPQNTSDSESEEEHVVTNINHESSSSEDDDGDIVNEISGYVPLSMNDGNDDNNDHHIQMIEGDSNDAECIESQEVPQTDTATSASVSTDITTEETHINMDNDQIKLIQQVMTNISLPSSSIPEWAKVVPEDRWKNSLLTSLENRTHTKTEPERTDHQE
ncbi:uncharacterized protein LOC110252761 [Exaiptasia diaphana]|uniref:Male-enhanced antigen 1 n=1 Tax=Exaiptasia diaphana TaxID=2652724 RepID=A0A913Y6U2_EXADI|nr:uncharacterized protein LOC110252761 [Exaiptasia diaphana]KXJ22280.1 hypothetical protein AC249_AIPGENE21161 [Exaiptasia diaphana]